MSAAKKTPKSPTTRRGTHCVKRLVRGMACKCGIHEWESDGDNIEGNLNGTITLVWWVCKHCAHSKLKCILR